MTCFLLVVVLVVASEFFLKGLIINNNGQLSEYLKIKDFFSGENYLFSIRVIRFLKIYFNIHFMIYNWFIKKYFSTEILDESEISTVSSPRDISSTGYIPSESLGSIASAPINCIPNSSVDSSLPGTPNLTDGSSYSSTSSSHMLLSQPQSLDNSRTENNEETPTTVWSISLSTYLVKPGFIHDVVLRQKQL